MRSAHTRCQCVEQLGAGGACARLALRWQRVEDSCFFPRRPESTKKSRRRYSHFTARVMAGHHGRWHSRAISSTRVLSSYIG